MKRRAKHAPRSLTSSQVSFRVVIIAIVLFLVFFAALYLNHRYLYSHFGTPQPAPSPNDTPTDTSGHTTDLTFYDRLVGKETEDSPSTAGGASSGQAPLSASTAPLKPGEKPPDPLSANGSVSAEAASASEDNSYTVQVGSFQTLEGAEKVLALLKQQGFEGSVSPVNLSNDRTWYRVRIGKFPVREEAERVTKKLKESGGFEPLIMPLKKAGHE